MALYSPDFAVGSSVRIAEEDDLMQFLREWKYHHPLQPNQLKYAGHAAKVAQVSFYHGGDVLYELSDIPGIWHESCLRSADAKRKDG